jgi:acyl-CoA thioesterase-1
MRAVLLLLFGLLLPATGQAQLCSAPDEPALPWAALPLARAAIARDSKLVILGVGGAPMAGEAAQDPERTYLARLRVHLARLLPKLVVEVENRAVPRRSASGNVRRLPEELAKTHPGLVIWESGSREAAMGVDQAAYAAALEGGVALAHAAGADVILVEAQFAPAFGALVNVGPYREIIQATGAAQDAPVFPRYQLMNFWNDAGVLDLQASGAAPQLAVTRQLFDCLGDRLARMIAVALK